MKISFSTLACPEWTLPQVVELATRSGYDGLELRFLEREDSLWKLPAFQGAALQQNRRMLSESGLEICCVDTSCRFDSPNSSELKKWILEGERMAELAMQLGAPGIRVFGDRIRPGADCESTSVWISESLNLLAEKLRCSGVETWLETHGDFACAADIQGILIHCPEIRIVWDAVSAFVEGGERPLVSGIALRPWIRHVHIKDMRNRNGDWTPVLTGEGELPMDEIRTVLKTIAYTGFLSFEWEKRWHPSIEDVDIAVPHFMGWFQKHWSDLCVENMDSPVPGGD